MHIAVSPNKMTITDKLGQRIGGDLDIATGLWEVSGVIVNEEGNSLFDCVIQLVINATNKPISDPIPIRFGEYKVWTDQNPTTISVVFSKKGYVSQKIQISKLYDAPDVIMKVDKGGFPAWQVALVVAGVAIYARKKGKVSGFDTSDIIGIGLIIGGVIGFKLIEKILRSLGIWGGGNVDAEQADPGSEWKPTYWQQFSTYTYTISESQAKSFASTIYNSFGIFSDNYNAILNVFSQMKTKANVSFLAWIFQREYDEDLLGFLTNGGGILPWDGLSTSHMDTIITLVNKLPKN